ncbi:glycosyltransferase [Salinisphaera shabanensis]|uniref:glycosyltransferase n=1 Tax=Salinisphaera shabanensis TaxID=180542 RepID=UPI0013778671|nr:glycosyltransferase [Salinisphaera shabanensis]
MITGLSVGGAERLLSALADQFADLGHDVTLVALGGPIALRPANSKVRVLGLGMRKSPISIALALFRLGRLIRAFKPDVVNSHLVHANILLRLLRLAVPLNYLVTSAHNVHEGSALRMWLYRVTDKLADISTNVSDEARDAFLTAGAVPSGRMRVIRNGIDTATYRFDAAARERLRESLCIAPSCSLILAAGRLTAQKDYPNLLNACSILARDKRDFCVVIVGTGQLESELKQLASRLGLDNRAQFLGVRNDMIELLSASDLFVLASEWEGLPMVILEAMACERPLVATNVGGVASVVGQFGWVVAPGDSAELACAMTTALDSSLAERSELGRRARERVKSEYSLSATADRYLSLYRGQKF